MKPETAVRSLVARMLLSGARRGLVRGRARLARRVRGAEPTVHYFHQADDPFSHLAAQTLAALDDRYRVRLLTHLAPPQTAVFDGDAQRYPRWALRDAADIAPFYGLAFPAGADLPDAAVVAAANRHLAAAVGTERFPDAAVAAGERLWRGDASQPQPLASEEATQAALRAGERLRKRLGHYRGGMFHFEGEWYWGVDRLCRLEERLVAEGWSRAPDAALCVPRPTPPDTSGLDAGGVYLEFFLSLRSPYTAVGFRPTLALVARSGVAFEPKPVLPMMMRGVPAPAAKGIYIITDAAREAEAAGERFGRMVDPLGEPVRVAFSLYPLARESGRALEYAQSYLDAAFADGIDISSRRGLKRVVERAGMDWAQAERRLGGDGWQEELDANIAQMNAAGLWGVPSYRVSGGANPEPFSCWGQDRLWRVESEIARRAGQITPSSRIDRISSSE